MVAEKVYLRNKISCLVCNISNTRKSVSSGYPNTEKCVEKRGRRPSFLTTSSVQPSRFRRDYPDFA